MDWLGDWTIPGNSEDCYALSFGLPCCNNNEVVMVSEEYGNLGIIERTGSYCGIGFPEEKEEMFGDYPYCDGCDANYVDKDGRWNLVDKTWCKVKEKKCFDICEPINGYQCCKDSSTQVILTDDDGTWGIENNHWCHIKTIPVFNDISIIARSIYDSMPGANVGNKANFMFSHEKNIDFEEKYEIVTLILNEEPIDPISVIYYSDNFRFYSRNFSEFNDIKMIIRDKTTNQKYYKYFFTTILRVS
ncbi:hypothetical protein BCR32DRAFT_272678 [Anaeromyces robustus]|uniref:CBM10 domain-containing protein n=1 Tax=Anaeromyces robustus TaxID=1754192 RepID=A0A1Y1VXF3_9FUNG|nr:hypothetical protein BCR32DRAFT_272678 [Anaeromyces robustus]|eukprot:ORX65991.1 hypothetical protein BCR32DRAFT_272678 [Anaeromyces robustus]